MICAGQIAVRHRSSGGKPPSYGDPRQHHCRVGGTRQHRIVVRGVVASATRSGSAAGVLGCGLAEAERLGGRPLGGSVTGWPGTSAWASAVGWDWAPQAQRWRAASAPRGSERLQVLRVTPRHWGTSRARSNRDCVLRTGWRNLGSSRYQPACPNPVVPGSKVSTMRSTAPGLSPPPSLAKRTASSMAPKNDNWDCKRFSKARPPSC